MLPEGDDLDTLIADLMKEDDGKPVDVALTPVSVTVSTSAKAEDSEEVEEVEEVEDQPVRRRGRPRKTQPAPNMSPMFDLPDDPADALVGTLGEDLSHMSLGQRRRYWEARLAAEERRKHKGLD